VEKGWRKKPQNRNPSAAAAGRAFAARNAARPQIFFMIFTQFSHEMKSLPIFSVVPGLKMRFSAHSQAARQFTFM
jgi:hypothetical protein